MISTVMSAVASKAIPEDAVALIQLPWPLTTRKSFAVTRPGHVAKRQAKVSAERHGRLAEHWAALCLMLQGYRILARRCTTAAGEIDIVAVRGKRITFIEVKHRATWDEAELAVRARQTARLHRAADQWVAARPYYRDHERGFDSVLLVPWAWPDYRRDALQPV